MNWLILITAGLLEVGWAIGLKYTDGFTKPAASITTFLLMIVSLYMLSIALRSLPMGTAYAIWVGVGMVGTVIVGALFFNEAFSLIKLVSLVLIITGIAGLKWSTS
ncbi:MAG: multidrug efflux SMR transporter [Pseudomonadota bacterium]|uniref:Guanidinium exporter n=1 Tax=Methylophaga aminisulfidivorans MP TaxID=1026882 RepID=F5SXM8_9GAMM|nr:multidrug efflux SMR transporter [Methylophaga aminisulfidivorans]EGL55225.1 quaternary ammonium compound-resistance protein sugE [Methylophaga aminisulfidivorans MP]MEC9411221.1 multidrug efflux SMR transporter [Pseudomonadota bacterium]